MRIVRFKPLWAIHNKTYRAYKKELVSSPIARYTEMLQQKMQNRIGKKVTQP